MSNKWHSLPVALAKTLSYSFLAGTFLLVAICADNDDIDYNQCYSPNVACFGVLKGVRSFGSNDGCIMHHNCNMILMTQRQTTAVDEVFYFTIVSRWGPDFKSSIAKFSVTNNNDPKFSELSHFQALAFRNQYKMGGECYVYHNNERIKVLSKNDPKESFISAFYEYDIATEPTNTTVRFTTKGPILKYEKPQYFPNVDLRKEVHVHLQFHKYNLQDVHEMDEASTDRKFKLYEQKSAQNSPTTIRPPVIPPRPTPVATVQTIKPTIKATTQPTTKRTIPTSVIIPTAKGIVTESPTSNPPLTTVSGSTKTKPNSTLTIVIIAAVVLIAIFILGIGLYCCLKKSSKKRSHSSERSKSPNSIESEHSDVIERIRGSKSSSKGKSGNYKKSYAETSYDTLPKKGSGVKKSAEMKNTGATTIYNNNDGYSTYFKR